jgi:hypothetical protein
MNVYLFIGAACKLVVAQHRSVGNPLKHLKMTRSSTLSVSALPQVEPEVKTEPVDVFVKVETPEPGHADKLEAPPAILGGRREVIKILDSSNDNTTSSSSSESTPELEVDFEPLQLT